MTARRYLTPKAKAELWQRQNGGCAHCRAPLVLAHADHKNPLWCSGTNEADNWQLLCIPCHGTKTKRETVSRGKTKRLESERLGGIKKRKGRKMQGPGFQRWRKFNGDIVEVRT